ncbi:hypothetical protein DZK27_02325 [Rhodobacteraceae bacterium 63075]|nr:hypothetical protein DZK27_02325 [Rhodobacteraceae bacterium 63075]
MPVAFALAVVAAPACAEDTIVDVYTALSAFGDTEAHPLVETRDGHAIVHSVFGNRQETVIDQTGRFLAYIQEGGGWGITTYKFWPLAGGGAVAATVRASFEREVMYPDTFVDFFAHGPGDPWSMIEAPLPPVDASDFLNRSPEPATTEARAMLASTEWALYHALRPDTDDLVVRLTATNRDKCWPETLFGFATGNKPDDELDFCRDVYADLTTELRFAPDRETGQFIIVAE